LFFLIGNKEEMILAKYESDAKALFWKTGSENKNGPLQSTGLQRAIVFCHFLAGKVE